MGAVVWPITESFGAEIGDVDLSKPVSDADWAVIDDAYNTYSVLVFPDQHLSQDGHVDIARHFGPIDASMQKNMDVDDNRIPPEIADVSNLDADGNVRADDDRMLGFSRGNQLWHTDSSFKPTPANASLLYMRSIPPVGGHTEYADMRAAWDALPQETQDALVGKIAIHSIATSRARLGFTMTEAENQTYPRVPQTMVRTHSASGRRSIYVASHAGEIVGMDQTEAEQLIAHLVEHATQRQFVYSHRWRANDLVIWDNKCTMHRGRPYEDTRWARDAQRATSLDVAPTWEQEGVTVAPELLGT